MLSPLESLVGLSETVCVAHLLHPQGPSMLWEDMVPCCQVSTCQSPPGHRDLGRDKPDLTSHLWHQVHPQKGNSGEGTDTQGRGNQRGHCSIKEGTFNRRAAPLRERDFPIGSQSVISPGSLEVLSARNLPVSFVSFSIYLYLWIRRHEEAVFSKDSGLLAMPSLHFFFLGKNPQSLGFLQRVATEREIPSKRIYALFPKKLIEILNISFVVLKSLKFTLKQNNQN